MMYKCGYCDKFFTSKKKRSDHERKVHGATIIATEQTATPATERNVSESERATESTIQQAIPAATPNDAVETPAIVPDDAEDDAEDDVVYHCHDCGTAIEKGQEVCPGCGEKLSWDGIE